MKNNIKKKNMGLALEAPEGMYNLNE